MIDEGICIPTLYFHRFRAKTREYSLSELHGGCGAYRSLSTMEEYDRMEGQHILLG